MNSDQTEPTPQTPESPPTAVGGNDEVAVGAVVDPATVRRAPRFGTFLGAGTAAGTALGVVLGVLFLTTATARALPKPGNYFALIVLGGAVTGALIAGALAVRADRRSLRGAGRPRHSRRRVERES